jgi:hypothetical protein
MNRFSSFKNAAAVVVLGGIIAAVVAVATASAASNKPYTANVHQTLNTPGSFTLTLSNDPNASQSLGSANFTAPAGFVLGAVTGIGGTGGSGFNVTLAGNVVQFRAKSSSQALAKGKTVSADVTVTSLGACSTATWTVEAKQSNDFSGQPGNDMTLGSSSDLTPLGSFEIADIGTPIAVDPGFTPAILLQKYTSSTVAYDTCHNVKANYTGADLTHHGLTGATISPATSLSWNGGTGKVDITPAYSETNNTITVKDGTTGITDTSNLFDTQQKICTLADASDCAWQNNNGSIKANASKPTTGSLGVGFDPVANVTWSCGGNPLGNTVITIAPHDVGSGDYQVTITYAKSVSGSGNANAFAVCESIDNGASFQQLQACSSYPTPVPPAQLPDCVVDQKRVTGGALQIILNLDPHDPYVGGK